MGTKNVRSVSTRRTHPGAKASEITKTEELRRSVLSCMLWEDSFYESGVSIAERIKTLSMEVPIADVVAIAREAKHEQHIRHVPLLMVCGLLARGARVRSLITELITRPDDMTELLSVYWDGGKQPLAKQLQRGLADAFQKFDAYQLAKYKGERRKVSLRDVMFLVRPKPKDAEQKAAFDALAERNAHADTWERRQSAGTHKKTDEEKRDTWVSLIEGRKLGGLAVLRNLYSMMRCGVPKPLVERAIAQASYKKVLPFQFLTAARAAPQFESAIEEQFLSTIQPWLSGRTIILADVSGSMYNTPVSERSTLTRMDAAVMLAVVARAACDDPVVYATAGNDRKRRHATKMVPSRRGIALADALIGQTEPLGGGGIFLTQAMEYLRAREDDVRRVIVITDEQDCDNSRAGSPAKAKLFPNARHYMLNVGTYQNGIAYEKFIHINGFSEVVIDYIGKYEQLQRSMYEQEDSFV